MTTASQDTTDETVTFSTEQGTVYLTGSEIQQIESDPYLTVEEIVAYRAGGEER